MEFLAIQIFLTLKLLVISVIDMSVSDKLALFK